MGFISLRISFIRSPPPSDEPVDIVSDARLWDMIGLWVGVTSSDREGLTLRSLIELYRGSDLSVSEEILAVSLPGLLPRPGGRGGGGAGLYRIESSCRLR